MKGEGERERERGKGGKREGGRERGGRGGGRRERVRERVSERETDKHEDMQSCPVPLKKLHHVHGQLLDQLSTTTQSTLVGHCTGHRNILRDR